VKDTTVYFALTIALSCFAEFSGKELLDIFWRGHAGGTELHEQAKTKNEKIIIKKLKKDDRQQSDWGRERSSRG
jgi:hypothetical protein